MGPRAMGPGVMGPGAMRPGVRVRLAPAALVLGFILAGEGAGAESVPAANASFGVGVDATMGALAQASGSARVGVEVLLGPRLSVGLSAAASLPQVSITQQPAWPVALSTGVSGGLVISLGPLVQIVPRLGAGVRWTAGTSGPPDAYGSIELGVALELTPETAVQLTPAVRVLFGAAGVRAGFGATVGLRNTLMRERSSPAVSEAQAEDPVAQSGGTADAGLSASGDAGSPAPEVAGPAGESVPAPHLTVTPRPFTPDGDGVDDTVLINAELPGVQSVVSWRLEIRDPAGNAFYTAAGEGAPPVSLSWDGRGASGELVEAAYDYPLAVEIQEGARRVLMEDAVSVGVLVIREGGLIRMRISGITFPADSPSLGEAGQAERLRNMETLQSVARILIRYPGYSIRIEGHANNLSWRDPEAAAREERAELSELSLGRAQSVKDALVGLGVEAERMDVAGLGGTRPVVSFGDEANRWKNRRVEFILTEGPLTERGSSSR